MKTLSFITLFFLTCASFAQTTTRPDTPYWRLVNEVDRTGVVAYQRYNWSETSLRKLLREVPTLSNLESQVGRRKIIYKMGGENPGKSGFTTLLPTGEIYVQVYHATYLKNIDVVLTLGHELIHAIHIDSGLHDSWKRDARTDGKKYAECMSESGAYTWSSIYAVNQSTRDWVNKQIQENTDCTKRLSR